MVPMAFLSGIWQHSESRVDEDLLRAFSVAGEQQGPDGGRTYVSGPVGMTFRAFYTTKESRRELQPYSSVSGNVVMWDGALDNRDELLLLLRKEDVPLEPTDVALAASAFEKWGTGCFGRFRGDWAMSVWQEHEQQLVLAKDYAGVKHLYYWPTPQKTVWCSHLDPIVLLSKTRFAINHEYVAGYLAFYPAAHLTPYRDVKAVPPGSFVVLRDGRAYIHSYWRPNSGTRIWYKTDAEYEDHFRHLFRQAVKRRLRSDSPVLSDLSGGFDSSSIVCMADDVIAKGEASTPRLDTFSCFDEVEPTCDERPYFGAVEEQRGRQGWRVNTTKYPTVAAVGGTIFTARPGYLQRNIQGMVEKASLMSSNGLRVALSGLGGDELLGGVPDPYPLIADDLVRFRIRDFARNLHDWSVIRKRTYADVLFKTLPFALPTPIRSSWTPLLKIPPWIRRPFAQTMTRAIRCMERSECDAYLLPSRRSYIQGLYSLMQQVAIAQPASVGYFEIRYPYLDQDLVEFLLAIPASQIQRAGQRRWLMRRALTSLLPQAVVSRKTKARGIRRWMIGMESYWQESGRMYSSPLSADFGYIDAARFNESVLEFIHGRTDFMIQFLRLISLEHWLRDHIERGIVSAPSSRAPSSLVYAHPEVDAQRHIKTHLARWSNPRTARWSNPKTERR
jgi:asparagine synthase (glutamine-hydrolysing)